MIERKKSNEKTRLPETRITTRQEYPQERLVPTSSKIESLRQNPHIEHALKQQIQDSDGKITFADFMQTSLYHEDGYYHSAHVAIGDGSEQTISDFDTSPEMHPVFGATIANCLEKTWRRQGYPKELTVIEMGAGNGTLARDVLAKMKSDKPSLYRRINYTIVEASPDLIAQQQQMLTGEPVEWVNANAYDLPLTNIRGTFLSNELIDTFPFHRVIRRNDEIKEIYITVDPQGNFVETEADLSTAITNSASLSNIPEGQERTVCPLAEKWMHGIGQALDYGHVLTIDYGQNANLDSMRARTYARGTNDTDISLALRYPGAVDITTSVDFMNLAQKGRAVKLETIPCYRRQNQFLHQYGFPEELDRLINLSRQEKGLTKGSEDYWESEESWEHDKWHKERAYSLIRGELGAYAVLLQEKSNTYPGQALM
jgi:SAM-dependent MidA family methyltransferase